MNHRWPTILNTISAGAVAACFAQAQGLEGPLWLTGLFFFSLVNVIWWSAESGRAWGIRSVRQEQDALNKSLGTLHHSIFELRESVRSYVDKLQVSDRGEP